MKINRTIRWFIANGIFLGIVYAGTVLGIIGASNLSIFLIWLLAFVSIFATSKAFIEKNMDVNDIIPKWLDVSFDSTILALLVWYGFIWTGIAYVFHMIMMAGLSDEVAKLNKKKASTENAD